MAYIIVKKKGSENNISVLIAVSMTCGGNEINSLKFLNDCRGTINCYINLTTFSCLRIVLSSTFPVDSQTLSYLQILSVSVKVFVQKQSHQNSPPSLYVSYFDCAILLLSKLILCGLFSQGFFSEYVSANKSFCVVIAILTVSDIRYMYIHMYVY